MLHAIALEPAQSPWASPVVLILTSHETCRFCVDYRRLNTITIRDTYPILSMDERIGALAEVIVFMDLDWKWGYWKVSVRKNDRDQTIFVCHSRSHCSKRMQFGLNNAQATCQRTIDIWMSHFKWRTCLFYLDDIIVFSNNMEDNLTDVEEFMSVLCDAGGTFKHRKCEFFTDIVKYLGQRINPEQLRIEKTGVSSLMGARGLQTKAQLHSFIGSFNVY